MSGLTAVLWSQMAKSSQAHGAKIEVSSQAVEIVATFDTGAPMAEAQVAVYAPDALDVPWQTGQTDGEGRFWFTPDTADGLWEVTVRKAGHGQTTTFSLDAEASDRALISSTQTSSHSPMAQKWLSMAAVIWGFVATAMYFSVKAGQKKSLMPSDDLPQQSGAPLLETAVASVRRDSKAAHDVKATHRESH